MKVVSRILGEAMTPTQTAIFSDPDKAYYWALVNKKRFPEAEPYVAKNPEVAFFYADNVIKGRWPEAEEIIAKSWLRDIYLRRFPEAKDDWVLSGWIDWLHT